MTTTMNTGAASLSDEWLESARFDASIAIDDKDGELTGCLDWCREFAALVLRHTATSQADAAPSDPLRGAVESMVTMLEEGEWAEHASTFKAPGDALASRLESAITDLHNQYQSYQQFLDETADATRPYARNALISCIAECQALSYSEDRGITVSEAESIGGVLHELRRLQNLEAEAVAIVTRDAAIAAGGAQEVVAPESAMDKELEWHWSTSDEGPMYPAYTDDVTEALSHALYESGIATLGEDPTTIFLCRFRPMKIDWRHHADWLLEHVDDTVIDYVAEGDIPTDQTDADALASALASIVKVNASAAYDNRQYSPGDSEYETALLRGRNDEAAAKRASPTGAPK